MPIRTVSESDSGIYLLIIRVISGMKTKVGAIGLIEFRPGVYAYCGSARRSLSARVRRHLVRKKKFHWHIDRLTCRPDVIIESVWVFSLDEMTECGLNSVVRTFPDAEPVSGFGSSDCKCDSHLTFLGSRTPNFGPEWNGRNVL